MQQKTCGAILSAIVCTLSLAGPPAMAANQTATNLIEAESADAYAGVLISGGAVSNVDNGDWLRYTQTNFGSGVTGFDAVVAVDPQYAGQKIEIRLDSVTGPKVGELTVQSTGGWNTYTTQSVQLTQAVSGVRDLYLVAVGTYGVGNIDRFQFKASTRDAQSVIEAESANTSSGVTVGGGGVSNVDNGDWVGYASLNFGSGVTGFDAWVAVDPAYAGQKLELRLDSVTGTKVGELTVQSTGGWSNFTKQSTTLTQAVSGTRSLYLVAVGTYGIANIDKFQFTTTASGTRSAFNEIEGESFNSSRNVFIEGNHVGGFDNGNWAGYSQIDFGTGAANLRALVAVDPAYANQRLEVRLGSATGTKVGELTLASTGGWNTYQWQTAALNQTVSGLKDVYLVAVGTYGAGNVDKFHFVAGTVTTPPGGSLVDSPPLSYSGQATVVIKDRRITGAPGNCITISGATTRVEIDNVELSGCNGHGISVSNSANVVIRNTRVSSLTHAVNTPSDGIFASNVNGLIVEDSRFSDIYTIGSGNTDLYGVAIRTSQVTNATIVRNNFTRVGSGLVAWNTSQTVDFSHNTGVIMMGPYPRGQLVQFAGVRGSGGRMTRTSGKRTSRTRV